ncbi:putative leucine-rich repeat protein (LRRP) [Trypanosoma rangeli]|uniref:Putative leucine-rich repeat protein (LRRP) n=1 Tax=Trypanosoma rangeli TaxID=5698 RepID=A0A422P4A5_TRYRA|nr:putative leucine-rich repeat protein (LRRP) [Trypanosoma rangeli]RNF12532.1 putative leucine-rich repeat protein (LRRP) [Trypanosoma rangeli]|eukprot:RNF12532.1 putative leucine-rich repeat protein (LRRP) [Trypanosoma rangeli]
MYNAVFGLKSDGDGSDDKVDGVVLLRNDASEFTPAELEALCRLRLSDDPAPSASSSTIGGCSAHAGAGKSGKGRSTRRIFSLLRDDRQSRCSSFRTLLLREELVGGTDSMADAVLSTSQLHVEGRELRDTSLVECFLNLTHLYIQHNHITSLDGLSLLVQLTVLVLHHNDVVSLRPLADLGALRFIDARFNSISTLDPSEDLPRDSLRYLSLLSNPCCRSESALTAERDAYRQSILECCPHLEMLDDLPCQTPTPSSDEAEDKSVEEGKTEDEEELSPERETTPTRPISSNVQGRRSCLRSRLSHMVKMGRTPLQKSPLPSSDSGNATETNDFTTAARLCQQFEHRSGSVLRRACDYAFKIPCLAQAGWVGDDVGNNAHDGDEGDDLLPLPLVQERETKSRLYADIHFALDMGNVRAQQVMENVWEDVDKVLRTRQALVSHRRERMELQRQRPSDAYAESLALLQKEQHTTDLDKYRS